MRRAIPSVALVVGVVLLVVGAVGGWLLLRQGPPDLPSVLTPPAAASTRLPVSRRVDPSVNRYMQTADRRTPASAMNGGQRWISTHAEPLVVHDSDPTVSLNTTGWASKPNVHVYVNATGVNLYRPAALRDASRWLVSKDGQPVLVDGWRMLDLRQPAARRWWLYGTDDTVSCNPNRDRRGALDLIACGYGGLWVDNVLTQPAQWFKPDPGIDAVQWGHAVVALLRELRSALPAGVPFTVNGHWTDVDFPYSDNPSLHPESALVQAGQVATQLVIENGAVDPGINYPATAETQWSYRRLLGYADWMHAYGVHLQWEKTSSTDLTRSAPALGALPSCRDGDYQRPQPAWKQGDAVWKANVRTSAFNDATALLTLLQGDSVGDMCQYPGRAWPGYAADLGAPAGDRIDTGQIIAREFAGGAVAVNPSSAPVRYTLPSGRTGVNLASTGSPTLPAPAASFSIGPRSAVVVQYSAAS